MRDTVNKTIGAGSDSHCQRAGLPVQPGVDIGSPALHRFKVQIQKPTGGTMHGGLWALTQEAAKAMLWLPKGYAVSIEEVTPFRAIFWDEAFLDHVLAPVVTQAPGQFQPMTAQAGTTGHLPDGEAISTSDAVKLANQRLAQVEALRQCLERVAKFAEASNPLPYQPEPAMLPAVALDLIRESVKPVLAALASGKELPHA